MAAAVAGLERHDPQALVQLHDEDWTSPWAIADPGDPSLERPWTEVLRDQVSRQLPRVAQDLERQLDERFARLRTHARAAGDGHLAEVFRPAPQALLELKQAADLAYDRGHLRRSVALDALASPHAPGSRQDARDQAVLNLLGLGPGVDPDLLLRAPGMPFPISSAGGSALRAPGGQVEGITVTWCVVPGYLLALDPWGAICWQRRIDSSSEPCLGDGGVLIRETGGVALIREDGSRVAPDQLGPAADGQPLAVAGDAAWFSHGTTILRRDLRQGCMDCFTLPAAPCGPPQVRGTRSLWLTRDDLLLYDQTHLIGSMHHGLHAQPDWRLDGQEGRLAIASPAHRWLVPDLGQQMAGQPVARRLELLGRAHRYEEVLALARQFPPGEEDLSARGAILRACFTLPYSSSDQVVALATCRSPQEVAWTDAWLARQLDRSDAAGWERDLLTQCQAQPDLLMPRDRSQLGLEEERWDQVVSGAAWEEAARSPVPHWPGPSSGGSLVLAPVPAPAGAEASALMRLEQGDDFTAITWSTANDRLLWRHRWKALPVPSGAPNRTHALRDGLLLVGEGASRLVLLECRLGDVLAVIDLATIDVEPSQTVVLPGEGSTGIRIAVLHPVAIHDHVTIADTHGEERTITLPGPARWMVVCPGNRLLLGMGSGAALTLDTAGNLSPITLPAALTQDAAPSPSASARGLLDGGLLYPWSP